MVVILYGSSFWNEILNFDALVRHGMIAEEDLNLFQFADDVDTAFKLLEAGLMYYQEFLKRNARDPRLRGGTQGGETARGMDPNLRDEGTSGTTSPAGGVHVELSRHGHMAPEVARESIDFLRALLP